jgi:peptidoglycan-N-acetylglucosamine deacetylase
MRRRSFLGAMGATAAVGGIAGVSQAATEGRPFVGYFEPPEGPLADRLDRPWEMTEEEWNRILGRVRAGRRLKPASWPGGARFAVALSFDTDHDIAMLAGGVTAPGQLGWGDRGRRVGVPRVLDVLARHDVPASFYIPAVGALVDPEDVRRMVGEGHEIGLHGWMHYPNNRLDRATEREKMLRAREVLEKVSGTEIVGHRSANFDMSEHTIELVVELGLEYDSSMMTDDSCFELLIDGGKKTNVVEVPVEWVRDDAVYLGFNRGGGRPYTSPEEVYKIFRRELEGAANEGDVFELLMHPHVIGHRSRIWIIEEIIRDAKALGGAWFGTHAQVARWVRDNA